MKKITDAWIRRNIPIPEGFRVVDGWIVPEVIDWVLTGALVEKGKWDYYIWDVRAPLFSPPLGGHAIPYMTWSPRFPAPESVPEGVIEPTREILARHQDERAVLTAIAESVDALDCDSYYHPICRAMDTVAAANWLAGRPNKAVDLLERFLARARRDPDFLLQDEEEQRRLGATTELLASIRAGSDEQTEALLRGNRDPMYEGLKLGTPAPPPRREAIPK